MGPSKEAVPPNHESPGKARVAGARTLTVLHTLSAPAWFPGRRFFLYSESGAGGVMGRCPIHSRRAGLSEVASERLRNQYLALGGQASVEGAQVREALPRELQLLVDFVSVGVLLPVRQLV